nr:DNA/RNA helicase, DEAD/DEAH box type, N-terminal [Tanacetum cinerariifolium]
MAVSGRGLDWVLAGIAGSARYASTLLIILSAKRVEGSFKVPRPYVSSMMASIDEDVEKSSLADQDDVKSGHVTPSRSSRRGDHRRSRIGVKNNLPPRVINWLDLEISGY